MEGVTSEDFFGVDGKKQDYNPQTDLPKSLGSSATQEQLPRLLNPNLLSVP